MLAQKVDNPDAYGMVWKQGRWLGVWKRRYFVLKGGTLHYFDSNKSGEPVKGSRGSFNLSQWKFERTPSITKSRPFMMKMVHSGDRSTFLLSTDGEQELRKWLTVTSEAYFQARFAAHLHKIIKCQAVFRGRQSRVKFHKMRRSAVLIQATYRMHKQRVSYIMLRLRLIKIQAYARRWLVRRDYKTIVRRKRIVAELLSTERMYVGNLLTTIELFQTPLAACSGSSSPILSSQDVSVLFSNITQVRNVNGILLEDLQKRIENWRIDSKVGDLFCEHANKLMMVYVPYVLQYSEAAECLDRNKKRSQQFRDLLQRATEDTRTKGLDIASFLIQPVQRLPRYELLLKDLLKNTESTHPDHADISEGLQRIVKVTMHINEKRREKESVVQVLDIKNNLIGQLVTQIEWEVHHRLVREGEATSTADPKVSYILLINDFLLLTYKQKDKFRVRGIVHLREASITSEEVIDGAQSMERIVIAAAGGDTVIIHAPVLGKSWSTEIAQVIEQIQARNITSPKLSSSRSVIMRPKGTLAKMVSFRLQSVSATQVPHSVAS